MCLCPGFVQVITLEQVKYACLCFFTIAFSMRVDEGTGCGCINQKQSSVKKNKVMGVNSHFKKHKTGGLSRSNIYNTVY